MSEVETNSGVMFLTKKSNHKSILEIKRSMKTSQMISVLEIVDEKNEEVKEEPKEKIIEEVKG